eukprot:1040058-Prymnesium_polylepis.1
MARANSRWGVPSRKMTRVCLMGPDQEPRDVKRVTGLKINFPTEYAALDTCYDRSPEDRATAGLCSSRLLVLYLTLSMHASRSRAGSCVASHSAATGSGASCAARSSASAGAPPRGGPCP